MTRNAHREHIESASPLTPDVSLQRGECPGRVNRRLMHCGKIASAFAASDEPPYGTSMLGAGALHCIKSSHQAEIVSVPRRAQEPIPSTFA
jgi:hypothetical protein